MLWTRHRFQKPAATAAGVGMEWTTRRNVEEQAPPEIVWSVTTGASGGMRGTLSLRTIRLVDERPLRIGRPALVGREGLDGQFNNRPFPPADAGGTEGGAWSHEDFSLRLSRAATSRLQGPAEISVAFGLAGIVRI